MTWLSEAGFVPEMHKFAVTTPAAARAQGRLQFCLGRGRLRAPFVFSDDTKEEGAAPSPPPGQKGPLSLGSLPACSPGSRGGSVVWR